VGGSLFGLSNLTAGGLIGNLVVAMVGAIVLHEVLRWVLHFAQTSDLLAMSCIIANGWHQTSCDDSDAPPSRGGIVQKSGAWT
jgi:hypothetical protein